MAHISEAKHKELENLLQQVFAQYQERGLAPADIEALIRDSKTLREMFARYKGLLSELLRVIRDYQGLQRKTRVRLRKLQLSNKQAVAGVNKVLFE